MTKIKNNLYICDWCDFEINDTPRGVVNIDSQFTKQRHIGRTNQLTCPKCLRYISQKTKIEKQFKK